METKLTVQDELPQGQVILTPVEISDHMRKSTGGVIAALERRRDEFLADLKSAHLRKHEAAQKEIDTLAASIQNAMDVAKSCAESLRLVQEASNIEADRVEKEVAAAEKKFGEMIAGQRVLLKNLEKI